MPSLHSPDREPDWSTLYGGAQNVPLDIARAVAVGPGGLADPAIEPGIDFIRRRADTAQREIAQFRSPEAVALSALFAAFREIPGLSRRELGDGCVIVEDAVRHLRAELSIAEHVEAMLTGYCDPHLGGWDSFRTRIAGRLKGVGLP